jgi:hypothetical protein
MVAIVRYNGIGIVFAITEVLIREFPIFFFRTIGRDTDQVLWIIKIA